MEILGKRSNKIDSDWNLFKTVMQAWKPTYLACKSENNDKIDSTEVA